MAAKGCFVNSTMGPEKRVKNNPVETSPKEHLSNF
jgi:hypothetical protein